MACLLAQSVAWQQVGILVAVAVLAAAMGAVLGWRSRGPAAAGSWPDDRQEQLARQLQDQVDELAATVELLQERLARIEETAGNLQSPEAPPDVPQAPPPTASFPSDPLHPSVEENPLVRRVHELADQGHAPVAIAQQLHQHIGTIELIIALRRQAAGRER